jgi:hypothetical protein
MKRFTLAGLALVSGALAACGGESTPPPADATPDMTTQPDVTESEVGADGGVDAIADRPGDTSADRPGDAAADRADAGPTCGRLPFTTIMRTGMSTTVRGDTTAAWMMQTSGRPTAASQVIRAPSGSMTCVPMTGQVVYSYTVGPMAAALNLSTTNMGTPRNFDTVLYVTTRCANTLTAAACNDDDPRFAAAADRRVSSYVTTEVLPAGTQVFIIIGGFYPPGTGNVTVDRGPFQLDITELPGVSMGGMCDPQGLLNRCDAPAGSDPLACVTAQPGAPMGTCRPRGSVAGAPCRDSEPRCDMGLSCSMGGVCQRASAADMPCDAFSVCPDGFSCYNSTLGFISGTCRRIGTQPGGPCRPAGAMGGRCDAPLVCSSDVDPSDTSPTCVRAAMAGGECDVFRSVCPMGTTCVTTSGAAAIGTCTAAGAGPRARCRAAAPRCDMGLECITVGEGAGAEELCLRRSMTNMPCGPALQCPEGNTCYLSDLTNRQDGVCGAEGAPGGACRMTAMGQCDGMATCSRADGAGLCGNVVAMGAACDRLRTRCAEDASCVLAMGSQTMGTCQPDGSVAGAQCRSGDMPCAMGLTCTGSALSGGTCARTVAAGAACDPMNGTTICPMGQYCLATTFNTGTCVAMTTMEMESNNNPADVAMRAATAPTLYRGTLERFDVDCYSVAVPANGRIVALVSNGNGYCNVGISGRLALDLYNPDGTVIRGIAQQNGPFGSGSCAHIDGNRTTLHPWAANLAAGTYTVCIRGVQDAAGGVTTQRVENYALSLSARAGM